MLLVRLEGLQKFLAMIRSMAEPPPRRNDHSVSAHSWFKKVRLLHSLLFYKNTDAIISHQQSQMSVEVQTPTWHRILEGYPDMTLTDSRKPTNQSALDSISTLSIGKTC